MNGLVCGCADRAGGAGPAVCAAGAPAPAPAPVAAVPAAPQEDEDEIAAVIAAIAAMMGCAPEQVRILSLREDSPWRPTLLISDGGQIDEKIPDKNKWKNIPNVTTWICKRYGI